MPVLGGAGYHHTLANIRTHVRANLAETDSTNSFWDNTTMLNQYVNQVLGDMALDGIVAEKTYTTTVSSGDQTYIPQSDVWKITRIDLGDKRLREIYEPDFDAVTGENWSSITREPVRWMWDGTYVRFDSVLDADETINVWYWAMPVELEADGDALSLDRAMLSVVVDGVCSRACLADKDDFRYQAYEARYQAGVQKALGHIQRRHESDPPVAHDTVGW